MSDIDCALEENMEPGECKLNASTVKLVWALFGSIMVLVVLCVGVSVAAYRAQTESLAAVVMVREVVNEGKTERARLEERIVAIQASQLRMEAQMSTGRTRP
ncbi:MAG TPA: hypothetical protein VMW52_02400 [Phycisphaerae bacterium]|nr:hypothetical protein [Phycisphaerae bacterium]